MSKEPLRSALRSIRPRKPTISPGTAMSTIWRAPFASILNVKAQPSATRNAFCRPDCLKRNSSPFFQYFGSSKDTRECGKFIGRNSGESVELSFEIGNSMHCLLSNRCNKTERATNKFPRPVDISEKPELSSIDARMINRRHVKLHENSPMRTF
ncbi:hypothetical protein QW131_30560 [Roseibium salinum]|nr:hypothetical protein [Roseibium salinum]